MPLKNPITIYDTLFRPMLINHGLWDQIRVDRGTEFALILFVQSLLSDYRTNTLREPYRQTPSIQNHMIERQWVEVNNRVNYPLKRALIELEGSSIINMECPMNAFCVSSLIMELCQVGLQRHITSWNNHRIPGKGIPNELVQSNNRIASPHQSTIPDTSTVVALYTDASVGGRLTIPLTGVGFDPLARSPELLQQRNLAMNREVLTPDELFSATVNGYHNQLAEALTFMIESTKELARCIQV